MKKFNFKLLSIVCIFTALLFVSCSETDENILPQEATKLNEQITPLFNESEIKLPERPEALILELQRLKKIESIKVYAAKSAATTIVVPRDYPTIQEALNAASPGDKIKLRPGLYNEELISIVKEGITLTGTNEVYLNGQIGIDADNVTVSYINIEYDFAHILIQNSSNVKILENTIIAKLEGYAGINVQNCPSTLISGNTINSPSVAIYLYSPNEEPGNSNTIIKDNTIATSYIGIKSNNSSNIKIQKNKITGKASENVSKTTSEENNYGQVGINLVNSSESIVAYNSCTNFGYGIYVQYTNNITIKRNNTFKNGTGIYSYISSFNRLISNQCLNNDSYGINIWYGDNCLVKGNIAYFNGNCGLYAIGSNHNFVSNYTDCEYNQYSNE